MKIFISQPFHGRNEKEILKERNAIIKAFENAYDCNVEVIDNYHKSEEDIAKGYIWLLGGSIQMMHDADMVIFTEDFDTAYECVVEERVASLYGLKKRYFHKGDFLIHKPIKPDDSWVCMRGL